MLFFWLTREKEGLEAGRQIIFGGFRGRFFRVMRFFRVNTRKSFAGVALELIGAHFEVDFFLVKDRFFSCHEAPCKGNPCMLTPDGPEIKPPDGPAGN